ncbi:MAG: hypothetical protein CMO74_13605 [Verrucomicrobiales bacterium]|nr:hypothetical protein [Verrucomicrobiales bacterium]|tara:strand:- start:301 stop:1245 length:945 start_codon:yes stop_codon:yes gene_type:complete
MSQRILFGVITVFWLVMNVLLWRAEHFGAKVPIETVWRRVLSPEEDITHYDIYRTRDNEWIGSFTWTATALDDNGTPLPLENLSREPAGYQIELDATPPNTEGLVTLSNGSQLEFTLDLLFDKQREWQEMTMTLNPPMTRRQVGGTLEREWSLALKSATTNDMVQIDFGRGPGEKQHLEINPSRDGLVGTAAHLMKEMGSESLLGGDQAYGALSSSGQIRKMLQMATASAAASSVLPHRRLKLAWESRYGTLPDHSRTLRVYRVHAPLEMGVLNFGDIVAYIGQNGELIRAELPLAGGIEIRSRRHYPRPRPKR